MYRYPNVILSHKKLSNLFLCLLKYVWPMGQPFIECRSWSEWRKNSLPPIEKRRDGPPSPRVGRWMDDLSPVVERENDGVSGRERAEWVDGGKIGTVRSRGLIQNLLRNCPQLIDYWSWYFRSYWNLWYHLLYWHQFSQVWRLAFHGLKDIFNNTFQIKYSFLNHTNFSSELIRSNSCLKSFICMKVYKSLNISSISSNKNFTYLACCLYFSKFRKCGCTY